MEAEAVFASVKGTVGFPFVLSPVVLPKVEAQLAAGRRSLQRLAVRLRARRIRVTCGRGGAIAKPQHPRRLCRCEKTVALRGRQLQNRLTPQSRLALGGGFDRVLRMLRFFQVALVVCCAAMLAHADKLHLKGGAVIEGKLLAEKEEVLVVDIGYTVLTLNRAEVQRIERTGAPVAQTAAKAKGLYTVAAKPPPLRPVKQLVEALGVSVVQVKTPGGLGSGFIIREDGHLITNFHVIEGETRISVEVYHQRDGQLERKTYRKVRIVAMNKFADLALLHITATRMRRHFTPCPWRQTPRSWKWASACSPSAVRWGSSVRSPRAL